MDCSMDTGISMNDIPTASNSSCGTSNTLSISSSKSKRKREETSNTIHKHDNNHRLPELESPNFSDLAQRYPEFAVAWSNLKKRQRNHGKKTVQIMDKQIKKNEFSTHVNFEFNLALTRALLDKHFHLSFTMSENNLVPPVPNRFHYVQWIGALLDESTLSSTSLNNTCSNGTTTSTTRQQYFQEDIPLYKRGMDIGTGASAIYLLLCARYFTNEYGWTFLGTDIDQDSIACAQENVQRNRLQDKIQLSLVSPTPKQQHDQNQQDMEIDSTFGNNNFTNDTVANGPISSAMHAARGYVTTTSSPLPNINIQTPAQPNQWVGFDFCMTNPPFYATQEEATTPRIGDLRSRTEMTIGEGVYPDGEVGFVMDMIQDSLVFRHCITWFSTTLGKKSSLVTLQKYLITLGFLRGSIRTTEFAHGKVVRWGLAWTFRKVNMRCPETKISTPSLQSFDVTLNDSNEMTRNQAVEEVTRRIMEFCSMDKLGLKCGIISQGNLVIVDKNEESNGTENKNSTRTMNNIDGVIPAIESEFLIDLRLTCRSSSTVGIRINSYGHSTKGVSVVKKVLDQIQGEITRTNRKWRRIQSRNGNGR